MRFGKYVVFILIFVLAGCAPSETAIQTAIAQTQAAVPTATATDIPTPVPTATATATATATILPTPTLGVGSTFVRAADGMEMVYVPEGEFTMGLDIVKAYYICKDNPTWPCSSNWFADFPEHKVILDAFWIDKTEVSNGMYRICEQAGVCLPPSDTRSSTHSGYYTDPQYANYPVLYVNWEGAKTFCEWAGGRLPTEAEWEKAARGTDGRLYPWGNTYPTEELANYGKWKIGDVVAVDSFANGISPYGALNMAGNVAEWVSDWYSENYYSSSPTYNPTGPATGTRKVVHGGWWAEHALWLLPSMRVMPEPWYTDDGFGFRCVVSK